jgi:UMF1 family MFS transporter
VIFGAAILLVKEATLFWIFGLALSLFFGPLQAASRSLMARIVDPAKTTEMFGLYAFSGRITAFIGPWLLGVVTLYFGSQRAGMATVLIFFTVGAILMCWVREASHNH